MVYEIRPHANHANHMIELEYQQAPTARSWMEYSRKEEPVAEESVPVLILSERPTPLPVAFEISRDWWCVSTPVKDLMTRLFGSQVAFYEVPVTVKKSNVIMPSTYFVTFSKFCDFINWEKSKVRKRMSSRLRPDTEVYALADRPDAAVFKVMPSDKQMIWVERSLRIENRIFSSDFKIYATDVAAQAIGDAFPGAFILRRHQEDPT